MSESEEDDKKFDNIREDRLKRVKEIRERKRAQKPGSDIEDGEVDSEGEFFVPTKEKKKATIENKQKVDSEPKKKTDKKSEKSKIKKSPKKVVEVSKIEEKNNVEVEKKNNDDEKSGSAEEKSGSAEQTENVEIEDKFTTILKPEEIESEKAENIKIVEQNPIQELHVVESESKKKADKLIQENSDNSIQSVEDSLKRVEESIKETEDSIKKTENSIKKVELEPPKLLEFLPPIQRSTPEPHKAVEPSDYTFSIRSREDALALESAPLQYPEETDEEWHRRTAEERKRLDKMEKLRQTRIRRMQAFQARTEIQEETVKHVKIIILSC